MPSNWQEVSLTEIYDIHSGLSKPRAEFGFGHGFLTFKDVLDNYFVPDSLTSLVNSTERERAACSVLRGDVFLTRTSETMEELGMSSVALKDYPSATFNGFTKRLRPKPGAAVVPEYIAYFLRGPRFRRDVTAMSSLSTRASLNNEMIERLRIVLPPVNVQQRIGAILKSLDDKIELNRRMNETLETMARRLFKSWFVDFDPVHAKAALRRRHPKLSNADLSRRALPNMAPEIAELFPDSFEDSTLGTIPHGWRATKWGELATLEYGKSLSDYRDSKGHFQVYGTNGPIGWHTQPLYNAAGIIIGRKGAYRGVHYSPKPFFVIDTAFYLVPKVELDLHWAYRELLAADINGMDSGSAIPSTSRQDFYSIPVRLPSLPVLNAYGEWCHAAGEISYSRGVESVKLQAIRGRLLPRLLSGELLT